jgi:hypothetical protein
MATISDCRATYGLSAVGTPTSTNVSGTVTIGAAQTQIRLTTANVAYSLRAIFAGSGDVLSLGMQDGDTTGSTTFVAGVAQVETATVTAASGITGSGNATVTVTAAGMAGSPKAISVALTTTAHTTATLIATAIAAALNADAAYSALFTATSSSATVITTRKPTSTFTVGSGTLNLYAANDGTLNVAIANGTCTGITTAATSANTTAGVISDGVKIYDGDGLDFEGVDIPTFSILNAVLFQNSGSGYVTAEGFADSLTITAGSICLFANETVDPFETGQTITAGGVADLTITVIGTTA